VICPEACWVCFNRCWMYTGDTLLGLLREMIVSWKSDRNLVG
jgi:hypothetical protein